MEPTDYVILAIPQAPTPFPLLPPQKTKWERGNTQITLPIAIANASHQKNSQFECDFKRRQIQEGKKQIKPLT